MCAKLLGRQWFSGFSAFSVIWFDGSIPCKRWWCTEPFKMFTAVLKFAASSLKLGCLPSIWTIWEEKKIQDPPAANTYMQQVGNAASETLHRPNLLAVFKSVHLLRVASPQACLFLVPRILVRVQLQHQLLEWGLRIEDRLSGGNSTWVHMQMDHWRPKLMRSCRDKCYGKNFGESLKFRPNVDWSIKGLYCFWGAQPKFDKSRAEKIWAVRVSQNQIRSTDITKMGPGALCVGYGVVPHLPGEGC